jgi:hypothetical protein
MRGTPELLLIWPALIFTSMQCSLRITLLSIEEPELAAEVPQVWILPRVPLISLQEVAQQERRR